MTALRNLLPLLLVATTASASEAGDGLRAALPAPIEREAHVLFTAMKGRDIQLIESSVTRLVELRTASHIANLTPVAAIYLARLKAATSEARPRAVAHLAELAVGLAPDYPDLRFSLAGALVNEGISNIGPATGAFLDGFSTYMRYPRGLMVLLSNIAFYLVFALMATTILVSLVLMLRHLPEVDHDLGDLFPAAPTGVFSLSDVVRSRRARFIIGSGLTRILTLAVVLLALAMPFALGLGLLAAAVVWTIVPAIYGRRSEVAAAILVVLATGAIHPVGMVLNLPSAAGKAEGAILWSCIREYCSDEDRTALTRLVLERRDDTWARLALALRELQDGQGRSGALATAAEHLKAAAQDRAGIIATSLGNVGIMRGLATCTATARPDAAMLRQASRDFEAPASRGLTEAMRGRALAQGLAGDRSGMEETLKGLVAVASDDDLSFVARVRTLTGSASSCSNMDAIVSELRFPAVQGGALALSGVDLAAVVPAVPFRQVVLSRMTPFSLAALAGGVLVAVIVILCVRRRMRLATICPRCGLVICPVCNRRESGFDFCPVCLLDQVRPGILDPLDQVAAQRRIGTGAARIRVHLNWLGIPLPGVGQLLSGRPLTGWALSTVLVFALVMVIAPVPPAVDGVAYQGLGGPGLPALPPVLLAVVYLLSAIDTWLHRRDV